MLAINYFFRLLVFVIISGQWPLTRAQLQQKQIQYFLKKAGLQREIYSPYNTRNGRFMNTNLDDFRDIYSAFRVFNTQHFKLNEKALLQRNRQQGKLQAKIPKTQKFPCDLNDTRSLAVPTSVHRLRPGDIDIIGAMGDSLTAGTAILADNLLQSSAEFRGMTMAGGGLKDWQTYLTLPNILKVFNPNLYGYAVGNTLARERPARFNVAELSAFTQDMPFQAHVLVKRLQNDPKVDMARQWKLITLFIGSNDVCSDMCYYDKSEDFFTLHRRSLYETLEILKTHVPRLLVNIIPVPNIADTYTKMRNVPLTCFLLQRVGCSCIISKKWSSSQMKQISRNVARVQEIDREVANLPEFQTDDFAALYQPFSANLTLPMLPNGDTDLRYFAVDCFHFSQLGQAVAANLLWNNMMQASNEKESTVRDPFLKFECPSAERPFIRTNRNS